MSAPFFVSVGFDNMVCANRVLAIITPRSKTSKNYVKMAKEAGTLIDVTMGKTVKSVILFDSGHVLLSHISTTTLRFRFSNIHQPKPWKSSEARREQDLGDDDVSVLVDSDGGDEDEEEDDFPLAQAELTDDEDDEEEEE